ncbi:MAG: hypothetical protein LBV34_28575 [Nocardiopsaceae bacterium]|jgi:hypothetical protein|nr:hypothetical protein [Nocardiopsaceae bacterium]
MIISAALCPAAPLLVRDLTGAEEVAADLREACLASVAELTAAAPDIIAVVGAASSTGIWNGAAALDLARYAPGQQRRADGPPGVSKGLPSALGIGAWLLARAGSTAGQLLQAVGADEPAATCAAVGAELAGSHERIALLVMADGSARRGPKAPGYADERSSGFDAEVEKAVREGRLDALLSVDPVLARELMAAGRPAWQVLAGAMEGREVTSEIRYSGDPFGVAYLVASLRAYEGS